MPNSKVTIEDEDQCIANLESKLEDMVELLHLWKNEAYSYRQLIEAILTGRFTHNRAKEALSRSESLNVYAFLPLKKGERDAFLAIANFAEMDPHEFFWSCLDTIMCHADDEDVLAGCREAAERRFRDDKMPEWSL